MSAGWATDKRATTAVGPRVARLVAAGLFGVGLLTNAAPAGAVVECSYDAEAATLTLQKRDGLTIGRDGTDITATYGPGTPADCGTASLTVETVDRVFVVADPLDNENERVTIDMTNGRFVNGAGEATRFSIDLGEREPDSLLIRGMSDSVDGDDITVTNTDVNLNDDPQMEIVTTGVETLEIRGNAGDDLINATDASFGAGQPAALGGSTANPGVTLVGDDGDDELIGGSGDDTLVGNRGTDTLVGNPGDDRLDTGPGGGMVNGGTGTDTADFSGMFLPIDANLGEGIASDGGNEYPLVDMENVIGTGFGDLLVGDDGPNVFDCNGGDDETYGMGGKDRLRGAGGDDTLHGSGSGDSLDGGDGDDTLHGGGSGDSIGGGSGSDTVHGGGSGSSRDVINSETGSDIIYGGKGRQVIFAGDGLDEVYGEEGDDLVDGQDGEDMVFGGPGKDTARGGDGPDQVYGGVDGDSVDGGDGDDEVYGDGGSDHVDGGAGDDVVFGGDDSDRLGGEDGDDVLNAGADGDRLNGHRGDDVLRGAAGNDTASFDGSRLGVTASLVDGAASGDGADALTDIENLWGSHLADSLQGDRFRNQLRGGRGADELAGGFGNDRESGDGGNDVLDQGLARNGGDILSGGDGHRDVVDYSARGHRVRVTRDGGANDGERGERDTVLRDVDRVRR